jgi:hypothetical protein
MCILVCASGWLDRAVFTAGPLVATLFRFFALEALLGSASDRLKNGPLALRQMTLSRIATGRFPTRTTRSSSTTRCAHTPCAGNGANGDPGAGERLRLGRPGHARSVPHDRQPARLHPPQAATRPARQLPGPRDLIAWIRDNGSAEWAQYLDGVTASQDQDSQPSAQTSNGTRPDSLDLRLSDSRPCSLPRGITELRSRPIRSLNQRPRDLPVTPYGGAIPPWPEPFQAGARSTQVRSSRKVARSEAP